MDQGDSEIAFPCFQHFTWASTKEWRTPIRQVHEMPMN